MAGHSKWANIKHKKAKQDKKKGKIFTKLIREITVAAGIGGGDASSNPRLRAAIQAALAQNMTRDTIDKAVKRGAGGGDGSHMDEIRYEGYGAGGVAVIVDCLTDNKNRTVAEVRHAFSKCSGNLGTDGSVAYQFEKKGIISFEPGCSEEKILDLALNSGALDIETHEDQSIDVLTSPELFLDISESFTKEKLIYANAEITMVPGNVVELDQEKAEKVNKLIDMLEDLDDVQNVYTNAQFPEGFLENLG
jgi:YebC/PmpR family DNA-binding regulatory protein